MALFAFGSFSFSRVLAGVTGSGWSRALGKQQVHGKVSQTLTAHRGSCGECQLTNALGNRPASQTSQENWPVTIAMGFEASEKRR